jgi:hypothetical protein
VKLKVHSTLFAAEIANMDDMGKDIPALGMSGATSGSRAARKA